MEKTNKRFIIIVLDSFGVGQMEDVKEVRPKDIGANTALHLMENSKNINWKTLCSLGLMYTLGKRDGNNYSDGMIYGVSNLKHYGADSYYGHQEIVGTNPPKPMFSTLSANIDKIEDDFVKNRFITRRIVKDGLELLNINDYIFIGDNMETDLGQVINVIGTLDYVNFKDIQEAGKIVRRNVKLARVIAFGGENVSREDLLKNIITKDDKFIGIDAPKSGVYRKNYHVEHMGYGVNIEKQLPYLLDKIEVLSYFYGKVADIVYNPKGKSFSCVKTEKIFEELLKDLRFVDEGLFFVNIQETDLAGHSQDIEKYVDRINASDIYIRKIIDSLKKGDILIVTADHGNDPTIGHSRHTREKVPILIDIPDYKGRVINIGERDTLADIGATAAEYFGTKIEFGNSFLSKITDI